MQRGHAVAAGAGLATAVLLLGLWAPTAPRVEGPTAEGLTHAQPVPGASPSPRAREGRPPGPPGEDAQNEAESAAEHDEPVGGSEQAPSTRPSRRGAANVPGPGGRRLPAASYTASAPSPRGSGGAEDGGGGGGGGGGGDDAFDDPGAEAEADWLEDTMSEFMAAVVPETGAEGLSRSCSPDGRSCAFEGPITDDSFVKRWIAAQADGDIDLQGVTLSELEFVQTDEGRRFHFTATAP